MFESSTDFDFDDDLNIKSPENRPESSTTKQPAPREIPNIECANDSNAKFGPKTPFRDNEECPETKKSKPTPPNENQNTLTCNRKKVVTRKFPGPAGVLPYRKATNISLLHDDNSSQKTQNDVIPCTQTSLSIFETSAWLNMIKDYTELCSKYDIKWIKSNSKLNKMANRKAPFLAAVIQNIDVSEDALPIITLKDKSGEIQGTIINNLFKKYADNLTIGSVIVLKRFAVLTTGTNLNNHHLMITVNNLERIYAKISSDNDGFEVIKVQDITLESRNSDSSDNIFEFEDDLDMTGDLERILEELGSSNERNQSVSSKPKFQFKKPKIPANTSSNQELSNPRDNEIWQNAFEDVDADLLFDDS